MDSFVLKWGYLAVFLASLIEGESVILPAGYFAAQGLLDLSYIMAVAFTGSLIADQTLFFLGQAWGKTLVERLSKKKPFLKEPVHKAFSFLQSKPTFFIMTFRFIYGIRIISPVIIGAAGISFRQFAPLNFIAAALWSFTSCMAGYLFGGFLLHHLSHTQRFFVLGSIGFLSLIWLGVKILSFYKKKGSA